ncbi:MAG TPA: KamA family radical SAM protein [Planctomycetota bacterium]|nr:KamA family radical SAM protein [Planctomycetota bacterium]
MLTREELRTYDQETFRTEASELLAVAAPCKTLSEARDALLEAVNKMYARTIRGDVSAHTVVRVRDCARALCSIFRERSDKLGGFSATQAFWDLARGVPRDDLQPAFYAELIHWVHGLRGLAPFHFIGDSTAHDGLSGRKAAVARSGELDRLWGRIEGKMSRYADGLAPEVRVRREQNRQRVLDVLGGSQADWDDWHWHTAHVITDAGVLGRITELSDTEQASIAAARSAGLPFGLTPYYASLLDREPGGSDRAIRAQVIPPADYVEFMSRKRDHRKACDFMRESDTSPVDRVTRRYPAIVILKPYNSCPQICVYCQRNWEINQPMAPGAMAADDELDAAIRWIDEHPAVKEVLITGGDPLVMDDEHVERLLTKLAAIKHVDLIRIGTRTPVTLPMRITERLAAMLGSFRELGRRDLAIVTHVEHPYEITLDMARAADRLRRAGLSVYNQQVFTFYVSRRFESAKLRMLLRRVGIEPYYTFVPKGKEETASYRVPIARILQEQKEEARLLPGLRRTDSPVYNIPGLGKNYLRAAQHRDLLTVLPSGSRVYGFHPWEKNIVNCRMHTAVDVPILDYLGRLADIGEHAEDYESIWYYF